MKIRSIAILALALTNVTVRAQTGPESDPCGCNAVLIPTVTVYSESRASHYAALAVINETNYEQIKTKLSTGFDFLVAPLGIGADASWEEFKTARQTYFAYNKVELTEQSAINHFTSTIEGVAEIWAKCKSDGCETPWKPLRISKPRRLTSETVAVTLVWSPPPGVGVLSFDPATTTVQPSTPENRARLAGSYAPQSQVILSFDCPTNQEFALVLNSGPQEACPTGYSALERLGPKAEVTSPDLNAELAKVRAELSELRDLVEKSRNPSNFWPPNSDDPRTDAELNIGQIMPQTTSGAPGGHTIRAFYSPFRARPTRGPLLPGSTYTTTIHAAPSDPRENGVCLDGALRIARIRYHGGMLHVAATASGTALAGDPGEPIGLSVSIVGHFKAANNNPGGLREVAAVPTWIMNTLGHNDNPKASATQQLLIRPEVDQLDLSVPLEVRINAFRAITRYSITIVESP